MQNAEQVTFGGSGFNRAAELRGDAVALTRMWNDPVARVMVIWRGKPLMQGDPLSQLVWLAVDHPILDHAVESAFFLGLENDGSPRFASDVSGWEPQHSADTVGDFVDQSERHYPGLPDDQRFGEARMVMARLSAQDAELIAAAKALASWHDSHKFCARCGAKSNVAEAGWQRRCPDCGGMHFPRTDPVVIMLITKGNNVLIGRSPHWSEDMYSLLAGFMEPGETLEAAVRREVYEETRVRVGAVTYLASQPWPFPTSLMIGCLGEAVSEEIVIDPKEIEDAIWVSREDMAQAHAGDHPQIKPARRGSIAQFLVGKWLADRLD